MPNPMPQEEEQHDSDNQYDPMAGRLTPYMNKGGIVDDDAPHMWPGGIAGGHEDDTLNQSVPDLPDQAPISSMAPPARPLPGMPPSVTPDAVAATLSQKPPQAPPAYGADQQLALEQELTKRRNGFIPTIANAGAGFADALMQGVARAGPGNFQSSLQNRLDKNDESIRSGMKDYRTGKAGEQKLAMESAEKDPTSPISRMAQKAAAPLFKSMGMTDEEIANIPASLTAEAQTKRLSLEDIRTKAAEARELHRLQFGQAKETLTETQRKNAADERARVDAQAQRDKEFKASHPVGTVVQSLIESNNNPATATAAATPGMVTIKASDGSMHMIPQKNINKAKQRDPGLEVIQ